MEKLIKCPTCKTVNTETAWNMETQKVMGMYNLDDTYTKYADRLELTAFRCPNQDCQDEVLTDKDGVLRTQDENGKPIIEGD